MKIQLVQQLSELDGGQFLEIFPGPYKGRSWNEQSVYVEDEAFALMEPIVKRHVPQFDHRTNTQINKDTWLAIIGDLLVLREKLESAQSMDDVQRQLGFREGTASGEFGSDFKGNSTLLVTLIDGWTDWLQRELESQSIISVLGI